MNSKTKSLQNVIKQKQPRTTYTSELRQRNLSVAKDLFLGAKIRTIFESSKCAGGKNALVLILVAGYHQALALGTNPLISLESR